MLAGGKRSLIRRRRNTADGDLDITPMIDVTFLLLIFFMVTSTMKGTPDKDIPAAVSGENANATEMIDLSILRANGPEEGTVLLEDRVVSLDELQAELTERARGGPLKLMIYAERGVKNGFVGDVESVIGDVDGTIEYKFAVLQLR